MKMKLIFIYGSPAVGKLTVAKELSKLIGYSIFHNHLTVDLPRVLYDFNNKKFSRYRDKLRYEFMKIAVKEGINLISTFVYAPKKSDNIYVKNIIKIVKENKGDICFVHLSAHKNELNRRVNEESRKLYHKIKKPNDLKKLLKLYNNFPKISYVDSLEIDNTNINPKRVALMIVKHFKLKKIIKNGV